MVETDKIVAAILTGVAYSKMEPVGAPTLVSMYGQFLNEMRSQHGMTEIQKVMKDAIRPWPQPASDGIYAFMSDGTHRKLAESGDADGAIRAFRDMESEAAWSADVIFTDDDGKAYTIDDMARAGIDMDVFDSARALLRDGVDLDDRAAVERALINPHKDDPKFSSFFIDWCIKTAKANKDAGGLQDVPGGQTGFVPTP